MFGLFTLRTISMPEERNCLQAFDVEGEGGYNNREYTFMDSATAYFHESMEANIKSVCSDDTKIKKINVGSETYTYIDNIIRIINRKCILYRDGTVDISGVNYLYPWLRDNWTKIRDTYTPKNASGGQQFLLMDNGELVNIDVSTRTDGIVKLTGIQRILTKNQAHRADMIVGAFDGSVYQVWLNSSSNSTSTGFIKINGLNLDDIQFCTCGDNPITKVVCYKNNLKRIYRFNLSNVFKISGVGEEIEELRLTDPNEYYISGMAQEFNLILLTNKRLIYCHTTTTKGKNNYTITDPKLLTYVRHNLIGGNRIVTPTAYTNIVKMNDESYYITPEVDGGDLGYCVLLKPPEPYTYFNTLKNYLTPIRMAR